MPPFERDTIRDLRESLELSQREFAARLEVPQSTVNRWETGRSSPTAHYLGMMADLARRHSRAFTPFASSTRPTERVEIAVVAAREWLNRTKGPRHGDRTTWVETFHQMLAIVSAKGGALRAARRRLEEEDALADEALEALLEEVKRALAGG